MDETRARVVDLDLNDILPNRFQPRIKFSEESIIELSESIKEHGVIQPIIVRPIGDKYEIIAGERRYKASVLAGKETIPCIISSLNDKDSAEIALIENVQRRDLTPIEEAISYKKILDMGYLTQEQLAIKLGKSQSAVANKIRLLNLCDEVQEALMEDRISERHARSILKLKETEKQKQILEKIIKERLTVRKTEEEIEKMNTFITEPIDEPVMENSSPAAFSPINPGFADVDKIANQAQEIVPENKPVDFNALLMSESSKNVSPTPVPLEPSFNVDSKVPTINPVPTVDPVPSLDAMLNPSPSPVTIPTVDAIPMVDSNPASSVGSIPTTPIVENPTVASDSMMSPQSDIFTANPFMDAPISNPSVSPMPTPVDPIPAVNPVGEEKNLSFADLLAPASKPLSTTPVVPSTNEVEPISSFPTPVTSSVSQPSPTLEPTTNVSPFEVPVIPTTPIVENSLPTPFIDTDEDNSSDSSGGNSIVAPEVLKDVAASSPVMPEEKPDIQPIIITDYSKQYDPVLPASQQPVEKVDFKKIINLIRDVNNTIEKCGYTIETEEYDLENEYQVIFKINKS